MADTGPYPQDALEANRAGRLTDTQRRNLRAMSRGLRTGELQIAAVVTVIGLLVWFAEGPAKYATVKPLIGIGCLIIAGILVARSFLGADALTQDVRSGRVESVEGAISKRVVPGRSATAMYYFDVEGRRIDVSRTAYEAAPEAGYVRVYYIPRSHRLVNMERLPDRQLPQGGPESPQEALKGIVTAMHSHNEVAFAEARAQMAAMASAMEMPMLGAAAPSPEDQRDPRPLAEAIVGSWTSGPMSIAFATDGRVEATLPSGHKRTGHWSVDSQGRLLTDVTGDREPADAWVAGNQLTVFSRGAGLTFTRAAN